MFHHLLDTSTQPAVSVADAAVVEGDAGTTEMLFEVSLSGLAEQEVVVHYEVANGVASDGDFDHVTGPATLPAGQLTTTIAVPIHGDTLVEGDEWFFLHLVGIEGAVLASEVESEKK